MRIRSIKPDFWASEDIAVLPWETRLLFIGLWSYVDDNGVGRDNEKLIKSDLFPLEDDPRDTLATVSRGLQQLSDGGQICRYVVDGKPYLHICAWGDHQRIDRPAKTRYPLLTCDDARDHSALATVSRQSRVTPATGAVEQGSRGVTEANASAAADADGPREPVEPSAPTVNQRAQALARHYCEAVPLSKFPAVMGIAKKAINTGIYDDQQIAHALDRIATEGRPLTVDVLRVELEGLPASGRRDATDQALRNSMARAQAATDSPTPLALLPGGNQ